MKKIPLILERGIDHTVAVTMVGVVMTHSQRRVPQLLAHHRHVLLETEYATFTSKVMSPGQLN